MTTNFGNTIASIPVANTPTLVINSNVTLTGAAYGKSYKVTGAYVVTLPTLISGSSGMNIGFMNDSTSSVTLNCQGSDYVRVMGVSVATITLVPGDSMVIQNTGGTFCLADSNPTKASLSSPTFTGTPTAPTAAVNTSTTQIATTAFVIGQASGLTPSADAAVASSGASNTFARGDHVHPPTDALIVNYTPAGTGAVATTVQNQLRNLQKWSVNVMDAPYYAAGDGATLGDTAKINAAILSVSVAGGGKVIIPAGFTFLLELSNQSGLSYATRQNAIIGQSNVTLQIDGTVKLKAGTNIGSTLGSLISAPDVGISNFKVTGTGVVDGNSSSVTATQTLNIYIPSVDNVSVQGIRSINASYVGIQLIPPLPYVSGTCITNCSVIGTVVKASGNIGIQVSHSTHNCVIGYNIVDTCGNNCIDVYASNSSAVADAGVVTIVGNAVYSGLTGVFVETSANVTTTGNSIYGCTTGMASNRVNGAPRNDVYTGNTIGQCVTGAIFTGDTGGALFTGNTLDAFSLVGLQLGDIANCSYVVATNNTFNAYNTTTTCIKILGSVASFNVIRQNYLLNTAQNPANLIVNTASTSVFNTIEPLMNVVDVQPVKKMFSGTSASSGTSTITVPASSVGKLVIKSSAGGAWNSVWAGSFTSDATQVKVAQESSTFTTPGNNVTSVTVTGASLVITITWAASGSAGSWFAWAEYF